MRVTILYLLVSIICSACVDREVISPFNAEARSLDRRLWSAFYVEKAVISNIDTHKKLRAVLRSKSFTRGYGYLLRDKDFEIDEYFVATGHRISPGEGTVFAARVFEGYAGVPPITDQEAFEKLTVFVPSSISDGAGKVVMSSDEVVAFSSAGNSVFVGEGACFGYATGGRLWYERISQSELVVDIDIRLQLFPGTVGPRECPDVSLKQRLVFFKKEIDDLTAWDGRPGESIYHETADEKFYEPRPSASPSPR